jgi:hypothetical protein
MALLLAPQRSSKEPLGGALIATRLNQDIDHVAILIHSSPKIVLLAINPNENLIQVPAITETTLTPLQIPSIVGTELLAPDSNGFIRDDDSTFGETILDITEAHAEAMINPDGVADDFRREPMAMIAGLVALHRTSLSVLPPKLTMPLFVENTPFSETSTANLPGPKVRISSDAKRNVYASSP